MPALQMGFDSPDDTHDQGGQSQNKHDLKDYEQEPGCHPEFPYIATISKKMSAPKMYARYNDKQPAWITGKPVGQRRKKLDHGIVQVFQKDRLNRKFKVSPLRGIVGILQEILFRV